jgi:signal peptidase I
VTDTTNPKAKGLDWLAELRGLALMLLAVVGFHSLVAKPFYIPSISMMPNLLVGDRLVVSKWPFGWNWSSASFHVLPRKTWRVMGKTPEYGDIVIVIPPNRTDDLIKRVVALPGDRIAVVNGQIGIEPHAGHGLTYDNVQAIAAIPQLAELNIGHYLIGEAIFTGLDHAVRRMRELMDAAR